MKRNNRNTTGGFNKISETLAKCWKCNEVLPIEQFPILRKNTKYEYTLGYCNKCRKEQIYSNYNNDKYRILKDRYLRLRSRAINKDIRFEISYEYFLSIYERQKGLCFYTDQEMVLKVGDGKNPSSFSVDKILIDSGYVEDNIVFCCNRINTIKNNMSISEMKLWTPDWYNRIIDMWRNTLGLPCFQVNYGNF